MISDEAGDIISSVIGWTYFACWTVSFWPQIILNIRRRSVEGLSFDFVFLNIIGFACYSTYNLSLYYNSTIQEQYRKEYGKDSLVQPNDVFFAIHAMFATVITGIQIFVFNRGNQTLSLVGKFMIPGYIIGIGAYALVVQLKPLEWLWFVVVIAYVKLSISFVKYCPQVYLNWKRKSTVGWTIWNVLLDFSGGLLSVLQLLFDSWRKGIWSGFSWDPKFILGNMSIMFDVIFIVQHYILYPQNRGYQHFVDQENPEIDGERTEVDLTLYKHYDRLGERL